MHPRYSGQPAVPADTTPPYPFNGAIQPWQAVTEGPPTRRDVRTQRFPRRTGAPSRWTAAEDDQAHLQELERLVLSGETPQQVDGRGPLSWKLQTHARPVQPQSRLQHAGVRGKATEHGPPKQAREARNRTSGSGHSEDARQDSRLEFGRHRWQGPQEAVAAQGMGFSSRDWTGHGAHPTQSGSGPLPFTTAMPSAPMSALPRQQGLEAAANFVGQAAMTAMMSLLDNNSLPNSRHGEQAMSSCEPSIPPTRWTSSSGAVPRSGQGSAPTGARAPASLEGPRDGFTNFKPRDRRQPDHATQVLPAEWEPTPNGSRREALDAFSEAASFLAQASDQCRHETARSSGNLPGMRHNEHLRDKEDGSSIGEGKPTLSIPQQRFRAQFRKTQLCRYFLSSECWNGSQCDFAHGEEELRSPPDLNKTSLCKMWEQGSCPLPAEECEFAHGPEDLRATSVYCKTSLCKQHYLGRCQLGDRCRHAHSPAEIQTPIFGRTGKPKASLAAGPLGDIPLPEQWDVSLRPDPGSQGSEVAEGSGQPVKPKDSAVAEADTADDEDVTRILFSF